MGLKLGSLLLAVLVCGASLASVLGQPSSYSGGGAVNIQKQKQKQQSNVTRPATTTINSGKPPPRQQAGEDEYLIGVGIGDITGPAADINLMGYAKPSQDAGGIHLRQFSRAIMIEDIHGARLLYISLDNGMISQLLRSRVLEKLEQQYGPNTFNESNVMMTASHSHSCPGGFFQYMLYNIPSSGFIAQTLEALVGGILRSVERANENVRPARIYFNEGELLEASINRSPTSYLNNPIEERARYEHDTDKMMYLLKMVDLESNEPLAMINWFPVHGTSMNNSNHLISGDNKGYAALLFEEQFNPPGTLPGKGKFVAVFAQANEGDVSPNTRGARCVDSGLPCDVASSTCGSPARVKRHQRRQQQQRQNRDMNRELPSIEGYLKQIETMQHAASLEPRPHGRGKRSVFCDWLLTLGLRKKSGLNSAERSSSAQTINLPRQQIENKQDEPNEKCVAFGPGKDMFESTKIIAYKQYYKARQLFEDTKNEVKISGPVRFIHEHIDMTQQRVPLYNSVIELAKRQYPNPNIAVNSSYHTCPAALGYSFAAGTTDGPGMFDFQQGNTVSTRYWNMVRDILRRPSPEQIDCHKPKPIILSTGEMDFPYTWHPRIVPTQILQLGQLAIVGLPGEFTTMAGRRIRDTVRQSLLDGMRRDSSGWSPSASGETQKSILVQSIQEASASNSTPESSKTEKRSSRSPRNDNHDDGVNDQQQDIKVVLSGLSNIYTSYVTTLEEYEVQRYEGASTLYGPHTLRAYENQFARLAWHLASGESLDEQQHEKSEEGGKLEPPDLSSSLFCLKPGVLFDSAPRGHAFGDVLEDAAESYRCGDLVRVAFVAGHPRNDLKQESSFVFVEQFKGNGSWLVVATDSSWSTKFIWERTNTFLGESRAIVEWEIPTSSSSSSSSSHTSGCQPGLYRIRHEGAHKSILQKVSQYEGQSRAFKVE